MGEISRRAIVLVPFGPLACHKLVLAPGERARIGRDPSVELPLPFDARASLDHCEVAWDGQALLVRDLGSAAGTWVRGERVEEAPLPHGGSLHVGTTTLSFYLEGATPARFSVSDEARGAADRALAALAAEAEAACYAVLDAAKSPRILELLRESVDEFRSLYEGVQGQALADVAPYLVRLSPDSWLLRALLEEGLGGAWGIFLSCDRPMREVRRHLRRFLIVEEEETRKRLYFRFYDPRVLGDFLPMMTPRQRDEFFGDVRCFFHEDASLALVRHAARTNAPARREGDALVPHP